MPGTERERIPPELPPPGTAGSVNPQSCLFLYTANAKPGLEPLKPEQEILTSLPTPQQSTKAASSNKLMLCTKKEVKLYFLAFARLKDLAILITLKLHNPTTANHNLGQIPAAGRSQQGGRH